MPPRRLFRHEPDVIGVPPLHAFVQTRRHLGVDGDVVEEDLREALFWGEVTSEERAIAAFCAEYVDLAAGVFPVLRDPDGHWQWVKE